MRILKRLRYNAQALTDLRDIRQQMLNSPAQLDEGRRARDHRVRALGARAADSASELVEKIGGTVVPSISERHLRPLTDLEPNKTGLEARFQPCTMPLRFTLARRTTRSRGIAAFPTFTHIKLFLFSQRQENLMSTSTYEAASPTFRMF